MNEPLKHKLFSVYGQILNKKILTEAWQKVKANKGSGGVDKVSIKDFDKNLDRNIEDLLTSLKEKSYKPSPVLRRYIPKKNGKLRPLGIPTIKDRIVQQALVMRLSPFFEENVFHDNSCGFRENRGVELAIKKVVSRIETGYLYIYDFDIKGYFDNIPHKKLMKVLNKYVSDGTVLDIIWKSLKAGYMEDDIIYETPKGTMQGGVISPLLANIYLNELDWELAKANLEFVRYADDSIVMCKTKEDLDKAKEVVKRVLDDLGLELAEDKTDDIDFHNKDFDFLGFTFKHLALSKKGRVYYILRPSDSSLKKFKSEFKALIKKSYTYSFEKWKDILNPKLQGKFNYFLIANKVIKDIETLSKESGRDFHGIAYSSYRELDGYIRQRLRVNFANRGKRHARLMDGFLLSVKYGNKFFIKDMKLISGQYLFNKVFDDDLTIDDFLDKLDKKSKKKNSRNKYDKSEFFKIAYAK